MRRVIAVLGGNAFVPPDGALSMAGQFRFARQALAQLAPLLRLGVGLVVSHGNGPQVGHMLVRVEESLGRAYALPLEVCVAESEGELGYVLEQSLYNVLADLDLSRPVASLLTQVEVDERDAAFGAPSKPIGPAYGPEQAAVLAEKGFAVGEEAGRGWRRLVPSPEPRAIVEAGVIGQLLDLGVLVIAAGGGGIPVVRRGGRLVGIDAVIDKDLTAALLGEAIDADLLVILTAVPCAYRQFRAEGQSPIGRVTASEARALAAEGHFAPGSMGPKIDAAIRFASRTGRRAIICDPNGLAAALDGHAGTIVVPDAPREP